MTTRREAEPGNGERDETPQKHRAHQSSRAENQTFTLKEPLNSTFLFFQVFIILFYFVLFCFTLQKPLTTRRSFPNSSA